MDKRKAKVLFSNKEGKRIYDLFCSAVSDFGMREIMLKGVLIGFSGGADSVMLTLFLLEYREREKLDFPILAVHINHGIRELEALRDEEFSRRFCEGLGIEFLSYSIDVPSLAKTSGKSLEEEARDVRYSQFLDIISGRDDVSSIALGHNATDNLETVIFNMMRGAGSRGIAGIPPVRDNIFRPMIFIAKPEIEAFLVSSGIDFVTDSTNLDTAYTRNYIRHKIIPLLLKLTDTPEVSVSRLTQNIRLDDEYIQGVARDFLHECNGVPKASALLELHPSVFSRVISTMARQFSGKSPEKVHIMKIRELLGSGNFSYSLPGECRFVSSYGDCFLKKNAEKTFEPMYIPIEFGCNELPKYSARVEISREKKKISHNVYKFSIQADLSSAIIKGGLYIRSKQDGDEYFFGGMNHKVKKMFIDRKIPKDERLRVPVLCDDAGILWIAGFGARNDGGGEPLYVTVSFDDYNSMQGFYIPKAK